MCGIVGVVDNRNAVERDQLRVMRDAMVHRGPDDRGLWLDRNGAVGFGHRRLAVIDLTSAGHQPMHDVSGRYTITFNGEIYNYRQLRRDLESHGYSFRTPGDTEVILQAYAAWGTACVERMNGMFAFAIYDSERRVLFAARDRAGEKPLYYGRHNGRFVFASELKAIMACRDLPRVLDANAFNHYLAFGYVPRDLCILKGFNKLPPAHWLLFQPDTDTIRVERYWHPSAGPPPGEAEAGDPEALTEELRQLLSAAVKLQLTADVPVGLMLSGGVDSSLVTALAAEAAGRRLNTFTVVFPGHAKHDESGFARQVADHFGTTHVELPAETATPDLLASLATQYDEPFGDSSAIPTFLVSKLIRQHATVALSGDGGDELFAGYPHYTWIERAATLRRFCPSLIRTVGAYAGSRCLSQGVRGRNHLVGLAGDDSWGLAHVNLFFTGRDRQRVVSSGLARLLRSFASPELLKAGLVDSGTLLQRATQTDFQTYLPDDLLVKVDRASMLNSLEVRAPFLDHRVVEFAFNRLPDRLRANGKARKVILRGLAKRLLPNSLVLERKQGFSVPLAAWLQGTWGSFVESVLSEADESFFNRRTLNGLLQDQKKGYHNAERLFALTMFELWRRHYNISLDGSGLGS